VGTRGRQLATALLATLTSLFSASQAAASEPPVWSWRQILSTPRIGGRLSAIAVDRLDPDRIFVGTEEGTVVRSFDGGLTWREIELSQSTLKDRNMGLRQPGLPKLGATSPTDFQIFLDPPESTYEARVGPLFDTLFFSTRPSFVFAGFLPPAERVPQTLLADAAASRRVYTTPVRRIAICPGNVFNLLVATTREVFGSPDDGLTYVRLFALPGRDPITRKTRSAPTMVDHVLCAEGDPRRVAVATRIGLFLSTDGGLSFDQNLSGWPGQRITALGYAPPLAGDENARLFSASGQVLFAGDPDSEDGLQRVYPDFKNAATAPWKTIRWISAAPDGAIWLATDDGVRLSADGGTNWNVAARTLFNRQKIRQVEMGTSDVGARRVVVMSRDWIYASDDGGDSWHPFFNGVTRRSFSQMATVTDPGGGTRWWVATSGGVWTTGGAAPVAGQVDEDSVEWARRQLAATPPLTELMRAILDEMGVSSDRIEGMVDTIRSANLLPRLDVRAVLERRVDAARRGQLGTFGAGLPPMGPNWLPTSENVDLGSWTRDRDHLREEWAVFVQATWELYYTNLAIERFTAPRKQLHELRRQLGFATEDAWHERMLHLEALAAGLTDPIEILSKRARIESLEAILETWLRRPLEEL